MDQQFLPMDIGYLGGKDPGNEGKLCVRVQDVDYFTRHMYFFFDARNVACMQLI